MLNSKCLILIVLVSSLIVKPQPVSSAKILSIEFFGGKSHVITYLTLLEELARRGHDVTLVSPAQGLSQEKSIKEIYTTGFDSSEEETNLFEMKEANIELDVFSFMADLLPRKCKEVYARPEIKTLMTEKFDLVMIQPFFNDCALGLVHLLKAPLVLFSPTSATNMMVSSLGGYLPPSFVPNPFLGLPNEMTFLQRMKNFGFNIFMDSFLHFYYEPIMEKTYRDILGQDLPSVREILANASLMLANGHFSLSGAKPNLPDVIDVGGIHSRPAKALPKDLEDFVSKSGKDGFILFSFGSGSKSSLMPEKKRKLFLNVFSKLKQQVLWKWESDPIPGLPKNVKLSPWLPQQDLLGHKGMKIFITHCGLGGIEEAIYNGVPLLGIPMFGDQPLNAKQNKNHGLLLDLEWNDLTEEMLLDSINELLSNSKYRDNAKRLSSIFRDQPNSPLERGVYWIEYVIRHQGAPHLKSASRKLNTIQYHSLDVIAAYLAIIFGSIYLMFTLLRKLVRCVFGGSKSNRKVVSRKIKINLFKPL